MTQTQAQPHDAFIRYLMSDLEVARGELRAVLPREIAEVIDWPTLRAEPGAYVDAELRGLCSDLVFSAGFIDGCGIPLYMLFEHQSRPDPTMPFRMLRYAWLAMETRGKASAGAGVLPPVVGIVFYHGARPWSVSPELRDVIYLPKGFDLGALIPRFRYLLDDVSDPNANDFEDREPPRLRLALLVLRELARQPSGEGIAGLLGTFRSVVMRTVDSSSGYASITALLRYLWTVTKLEPQQVIARLDPLLRPAVENHMVSTAQRLQNEGRLDALRSTLRKQMVRRFGSLSAPVLARIDVASAEQLEAWLDRIFDAPSPDDALADPPSN